MDSSREIRSMIMVAFPCPPIEMSDGQNSHDLISFLIDAVSRRNDNRQNANRKLEQERLTLDFLDDFPNCSTIEEIENCMSRFTRDYMLTYFPIMHEIRFNSIIYTNNAVKQQLCSWIAAQYILNNEDCNAIDFLHLTPEKLYFVARDLVKKSKDITWTIDANSNNNGDSQQLEFFQKTKAS